MESRPDRSGSNDDGLRFSRDDEMERLWTQTVSCPEVPRRIVATSRRSPAGNVNGGLTAITCLRGKWQQESLKTAATQSNTTGKARVEGTNAP